MKTSRQERDQFQNGVVRMDGEKRYYGKRTGRYFGEANLERHFDRFTNWSDYDDFDSTSEIEYSEIEQIDYSEITNVEIHNEEQLKQDESLLGDNAVEIQNTVKEQPKNRKQKNVKESKMVTEDKANVKRKESKASKANNGDHRQAEGKSNKSVKADQIESISDSKREQKQVKQFVEISSIKKIRYSLRKREQFCLDFLKNQKSSQKGKEGDSGEETIIEDNSGSIKRVTLHQKGIISSNNNVSIQQDRYDPFMQKGSASKGLTRAEVRLEDDQQNVANKRGKQHRPDKNDILANSEQRMQIDEKRQNVSTRPHKVEQKMDIVEDKPKRQYKVKSKPVPKIHPRKTKDIRISKEKSHLSHSRSNKKDQDQDYPTKIRKIDGTTHQKKTRGVVQTTQEKQKRVRSKPWNFKKSYTTLEGLNYFTSNQTCALFFEALGFQRFQMGQMGLIEVTGTKIQCGYLLRVNEKLSSSGFDFNKIIKDIPFVNRFDRLVIQGPSDVRVIFEQCGTESEYDLKRAVIVNRGDIFSIQNTTTQPRRIYLRLQRQQPEQFRC